MRTHELRAVELAITTVLKGEFYDADQREIDQFINDWRGAVKDHVRVVEGADNPMPVTFPVAVTMPEKSGQTGKIRA
jgi:hypothetical protein